MNDPCMLAIRDLRMNRGTMRNQSNKNLFGRLYHIPLSVFRIPQSRQKKLENPFTHSIVNRKMLNSCSKLNIKNSVQHSRHNTKFSFERRHCSSTSKNAWKWLLSESWKWNYSSRATLLYKNFIHENWFHGLGRCKVF